uniref:Fibronectin type-III domain-containing protein n=1 Tax=Callorhinchus milii TaxID=7868 RepID=A0A4W3GKS5_CALMI
NCKEVNTLTLSVPVLLVPVQQFLVGWGDEYEYEEEDQETVTEPVPGVTTRLCDYDRCRHGQRPCAELQLLAGPSNPCLCPGMADEDAPPDPPQLLPPTTITDSSAQLHWCEPLSTVRGYRLLLSNDGPAHRPDGPPLAPDARLHTLTGLRSATAYRVCVEAFNAAGQSRRLEGVAPRSSPERRHLDGPGLELGPCRRFTTKPSRYTVAAVGASGLLALLLVAVAAGACCRRAQPSTRGRHVLSCCDVSVTLPPSL